METLTLQTRSRDHWVDITREVQAAVKKRGLREGAVRVFVPHTTAGITLNEHADPDVVADLQAALNRLAPWDGPYRHGEGNSAAHLKATLTGSSVTVPVHEGHLALGTWQGIFFCEFDGPRSRQVCIQALADPVLDRTPPAA